MDASAHTFSYGAGAAGHGANLDFPALSVNGPRRAWARSYPARVSDSNDPAAQNLEDALARMTFEIVPGRFTLLGFEESPQAADLELVGDGPGQLTREGGETSLLLSSERGAAALARHPGATSETDLVWIRFRAPMSWEVVGFLARVTSALAEAGVPLGAVCGYSRDHLFIHERYLEATTSILDALFERHHPDRAL